MINKKYTSTEKNQGVVPMCKDERVLYVDIPCGQCIECRKKKARNWQVRLNEEIKIHKYNYFITLTFSNESLKQLMTESHLTECNALAGLAVRRHLELWRKHMKKQLKHWYITELGHENTERIHLHGLIMTDEPLEFTKTDLDHMYSWKFWRYGHVYVGDYVSNRTINYIVKYVNKVDNDHKGFNPQILCSPGIGRSYLTDDTKTIHKYKPRQTADFYRLNTGSRVAQPTYYRNKTYNEEERELIWRESMDKNQTVIMGTTYDTSYVKNEVLGNIVEKAKEVNRQMEYGDDSREWQKRPYNVTLRMLKRAEIREAEKLELLGDQMERERAKIREKAKKVRENLHNSKI